MFDIFLQNISSPPILFFILGIIAGYVKSDLNIPEQISHYLSTYLIMAIGFKGGVSISQTEVFDFEIIATIFAGIVTGMTQPLIGFYLLRKTTKLDKTTAAAISAHYGSISMVTFVTAVSFLEMNHIAYAGYIIAVLAIMEAPAIFSGLILANDSESKAMNIFKSKLGKDVLTNGAILLLAGSFFIGWISGDIGMKKMEGFLVTPFQGILAFFLLDMGLIVARQSHHLKEFNLRLVLFGIYMPLIGGLIAIIIAKLIGLDLGTATLFIVLVASSSYIAVTAAMKMALPQAKAGIYIPMTLAITFPFNISLGIPLYYKLAELFLV